MLAALLIALGAGGAFRAQAGGIAIDHPQLTASAEGGYVLSADFRFDVNRRMADVVARGVTLVFVLEFELKYPRWYWVDETVAKKRMTWRLSYHALTRQYRLSSDALYQSFATLEEALQRLSHISNWQTVRRALPPGTNFQAGLRFRLDVSQLPKPFQFSATTGRDLDFDSGWQYWTFVPPDAPPIPAAEPDAAAQQEAAAPALETP